MPGFNFHFLIVNSTRILSLSSHSVCLSVSAIVTSYLFSITLCDTNTNTQIQLVVWWFFKSHGTPFIQLLEYANPPPLSSLFTLTKNPDGEILETKRAFRDPLVSFSMPFEIMGLMYH